jgi:hypothetical protein
MTRLVRDRDGRMWTVHNRIEWSDPEAEQEFEHDVSGGRVGSMIMVVVLFVLFIAFVIYIPDTVKFPGWLAFGFVLLALFFPARWLTHRSWTLIAETPGGGKSGLPAERWVGSVRGYFTARSETARALRHLRHYAVPDRDRDGPLQPAVS